MGIPADMLPRVFDMFTQVDDSKNRAQGGLGIGLTLARSLVEMHGGSIAAHSDGPGRGSEFTVRLPLLCVAPQPAAPLAARPDRSSIPRRRILVVDNSPAAAFTFGKLLESLGQQVRTAANAQAALALVRMERPDMVISAMGMPHMNGYAFARHLREDPALDGVVLVALMEYGRDEDKQSAQAAGFDYQLVEPVSVEDLSDLLGSLPAPRGPVAEDQSAWITSREDA
jgi:CheY-like chemotaxis protein